MMENYTIVMSGSSAVERLTFERRDSPQRINAAVKSMLPFYWPVYYWAGIYLDGKLIAEFTSQVTAN